MFLIHRKQDVLDGFLGLSGNLHTEYIHEADLGQFPTWGDLPED